MTLVDVTQINANDEITAAGANLPHNQIATVVNGNLDDTNISGISGTKVTGGTLPVAAFDTNTNPETRMSESMGDYVASGAVWSATTGLGGAMTSGVIYVTGKRIAASAVSSKTFTASKDTYCSLDNTGSPQYTEVANGAAVPSLPSNNVWTAKVVTNGSAVTSVQDMRSTAPLSSSRRAWTPTLTNITKGNGTEVARYSLVGKELKFYYSLTLGTTSSVGDSSSKVSLPLPASSSYTQYSLLGQTAYFDASAGTTYVGVLIFDTGSTAILGTINTGVSTAFTIDTTTTVPFTWTSTDRITFSGSYEVA